MNNDSGTTISKPVPFLSKSIEVNFQDFSTALAKTGLDVVFGNWDNLTGDGVDVLAGLGLAAGDGEIAWLLVYRSLFQGMKNLVAEKTELELKQFDFHVLQNRINNALSNSSLSINKQFFAYPEKAEIVGLIQPPFVE